MGTSAAEQDRRRAYRVPCDEAQSPTLSLAGRIYQVTEAASGGLRIRKLPGESLRPGETHRATVLFPNGKSYRVRGTVLRDLGEELVFEFVNAIPATEFNRRSFYRVFYPDTVRPVLQVGKRQYEIVDLSEHGICLVADSATPQDIGQEMNGIIQLRNGGTFEIEGKVQRVFGERIALQLEYPLPLDLIIKEQRLLNRIYGAHSAESLKRYFEENLGFVAFQYFFASKLEGEDLVQRLHEIGRERQVNYEIVELRDRVNSLCEEKSFRKDLAVGVAYEILQWRKQMTHGKKKD